MKNTSSVPFKSINIDGEQDFLVPPPKTEVVNNINACQKMLGIMSDPSYLLYQSLKVEMQEQELKFHYFREIGNTPTMPFPADDKEKQK